MLSLRRGPRLGALFCFLARVVSRPVDSVHGLVYCPQSTTARRLVKGILDKTPPQKHFGNSVEMLWTNGSRAATIAKDVKGMNMYCDNCKFWEETQGMEGGIGIGLCHRHPPTMNWVFVVRSIVSGGFYHPEPLEEPDLWMWPATEDEDTCGEFQAREVPA